MKIQIIIYTPSGTFTPQPVEVNASNLWEAAAELFTDYWIPTGKPFVFRAQSGGVLAFSRELLGSSMLLVEEAK